jgi:hypothetical protein
MDNPEPTEAERELEGSERHEQEDAMRGPDAAQQPEPADDHEAHDA